MFLQHKSLSEGEPQGTPLALRDEKQSGAVAFVAEAVGKQPRFHDQNASRRVRGQCETGSQTRRRAISRGKSDRHACVEGACFDSDTAQVRLVAVEGEDKSHDAVL